MACCPSFRRHPNTVFISPVSIADDTMSSLHRQNVLYVSLWRPKQFLGFCWRYPGLQCQGVGPHSIVHTEHYRLASVPYRFVGRFCGVLREPIWRLWQRPYMGHPLSSLWPLVHHLRVLRQFRFPVMRSQVREPIAFWRLYQPSHPCCWTKHEFGVAWLVSSQSPL